MVSDVDEMPEPFAVAGADYVEQLLRVALHTPVAATDPSAGQVVGRLMVALGSKGEDERLAPYLSGRSGRHSRFDVTCYDNADRPAARVTDLGAGQATRALVGFSAAHPNCAVVVSERDDSGDERCVLVARGPVATYQFPDGSVPTLPPQEEVATLPPQEEVATLPPQEEVASPLPQRSEPSPPAPEPLPTPSPPDPREAEQWAALSERLESLPTADEVVTALGESLAGMTTELRERLSALSTTDEITVALRDLLAGMTVELDATVIEDVIHAALDEMPHPATPTGAGVVDVAEQTPAPPVLHMAPPPPAPVVEAVSINAELATDQVHEERCVRQGRAKPAAPARVPHRPPPDRAVDDTPTVVALTSRRR